MGILNPLPCSWVHASISSDFGVRRFELDHSQDSLFSLLWRYVVKPSPRRQGHEGSIARIDEGDVEVEGFQFKLEQGDFSNVTRV